MARPRVPRWIALLGTFVLLSVASAPSLAASNRPGDASGVDWRQYRFAANRPGFNPAETVLDVSNVSRLHVIWSVPTGGPIESSPSVVDGTVYIGSDDGNLYAIDASSGDVRWTAPTGAEVFGSPAVGDGLVYDTSGDNHLYAFDAATGVMSWSVDLGGAAPTQTSPALVGKVVVATSGTQTMYAVDAQVGQVLWSRPLRNQGCALDAGYSPSVANGIVYQTGCSIPLVAFELRHGAFLWKSEGPQPNGGPAVVRGAAFFPTNAGDMRGVSAATGTLRWATPGPPTGIQLDYPAVSPAGVVYEASYDQTGNPGYLTAWDARTGAIQWSTTLPCGATDMSPTVANGVVYVGYGFGCPNGLAAIDAATGQILLTLTLGGGSFEMRSSPSVVGGRVYVGTDAGRVVALGL
jgi:outer membrane protein assembly factor BamB